MLSLSDTHAHLYDIAFQEDRTAVFERMKTENIYPVFVPNVDSSTAANLVQLCSEHEQFYGMMGLHPCSVNQDVESELLAIREWVEKEKFIAIGEIGLDLYWEKKYLPQQIHAFKTQLHWSMEFDLPVAIHCRDAFDEIMQIVMDKEFDRVRGVFHCFTGNETQAKQLIDRGYYLGIGGVLTFKNSGLDKALEHIPLEHIVLETDAPYLAPVPFRGKRNEPSYLWHIAQKLAEIKQIDIEEVAEITNKNTRKLFGI